jgi:bis(5'-nucleosidyl)-tetraphosphatase
LAEVNSPQSLLEAAGLILFSLGQPRQFLLLKHADRWDLPKGHAEANETLLETALRETAEETGIPPDRIAVDDRFRFVLEYYVQGKKRGGYRKRVTYFLGTVPEPIECLTLTEHIGFQWWDWPVAGSIQQQTIDPLLDAVTQHFAPL